MNDDIANPVEAATTRRRALGAAVGLLVGGAVPLTATRATARSDGGPPDEWDMPGASDHVCAGEYDPEFEAALAAADDRLGTEETRGPREGPPQQYALPLRRGFRVTARYGIRGDWLAGHHTGIDLGVPRGTPVYAVGSGVVLVARWSGAYGNAVTVRMPDGHYALVAHLSSIAVREGARIGAGALLGRSGATGRATGPHLHLEVRARREYGSDINPVSYLARRGVRLL
ncbi:MULTISPECIES: M23 family metallopeptidase [Streptomyces]|uniref:Peptidase n=1 Tax=Streptomyces venezuelae TaxID=54571 RepID=A0A5P2BME8_STRVZ|nr:MULTISPECIES: M23 family metallopeptidase [Streptomyces]NEA02759.1 M23 family metallopeptidase [Streptomyces sp. SID10116]MYY83052.1 peptidoglycan DD-metalloendopeptidase family protein [Streptomyces sp. SID335]MYZ17572.1 peptidoglycan DD-metalloendopeptidase family protein [Streptomyces sp. SID337]NDZ84340.1 M23 family metallopeptidase [Streptomyces sp. SID10115]NEB47367.1 M23 family metallopeptidase [Streptomyces sp. SID339]